jgi:hypothetical protein
VLQPPLLMMMMMTMTLMRDTGAGREADEREGDLA